MNQTQPSGSAQLGVGRRPDTHSPPGRERAQRERCSKPGALQDPGQHPCPRSPCSRTATPSRNLVTSPTSCSGCVHSDPRPALAGGSCRHTSADEGVAQRASARELQSGFEPGAWLQSLCVTPHPSQKGRCSPARCALRVLSPPAHPGPQRRPTRTRAGIWVPVRNTGRAGFKPRPRVTA